MTNDDVMDLDIYADPPNVKDIVENMNKCTTIEQVKDLIIATFPTWIVHRTARYSQDYPQLQRNWEHICQRLNIEPREIILVDAIIQDQKHILLQIFCEIATQYGWVIRRKHEFVGCRVCGAAIPCKEMWNFMKERKLPIPETWDDKCSLC